MANVLTSANNVLSYDILLTTLFRACDLDLDSENDTRMSKPSDTIDNNYIARLGYEYNGRQWIEKARAPTIVDVNTDEEVEMDIPPPSPIVAYSPHSPPPSPTDGTSSSFDHLEWYQNLSQCINIFSLD